ncbi:MAG: DUF2852 domain-containing protein [Gammaproteobacteria bacterium]|nr:DUF2852 domain-containing protein [Gammaproteobacteria bacterium]
MSSTNYSTAEESQNQRYQCGMRMCGKGHWSGANIAAMVLGFIIFPPLGLAVLAWTILGYPIQELPGWIRDKWNQVFRSRSVQSKSKSGNSVFNDFQQTQYDRIQEIKEEIRKRAEAFRAYRDNISRRQDQQEFDEFMSSKPDKE